MLLQDTVLEKSSVVANSRMNRERGLTGVNSYERDLGVNPFAEIVARSKGSSTVAWLDLCCGTGKALIEASEHLAATGRQVLLHGVDLIDMFRQVPTANIPVRLEQASLHDWAPSQQYDLITCVHGLHYIGDNLGLIERIVTWLAPPRPVRGQS
jgi:trans-aconitate methyltransferase